MVDTHILVGASIIVVFIFYFIWFSFSEAENSEKFPRIREIIFNIYAIFMADVEAPRRIAYPAAQAIAKATAPKKT